MTNYNMLKLPNLGIAALLMNIGYIFLPPEIRDKLEPLADVELQTFIKHPQLGYEILKQHSRIPPEVAEAVLHHHERCNGSGYPARLRESDISFFAKIISIVDTYYSLVSKRPQRRTLMPHEAIEFIMAYGGELFDLDLVEIFARQVPLYPSGVTVKLSTKETGIIADANIGHIGRPVVRVCFDAHSQPLNKPYDIDLSDMKYQSILVTNALEY